MSRSAPVSNLAGIIGANIHRYRLARGYTLSQLATALADHGVVITNKTISEWERGTVHISAENIFNLSKVLGCTINALYGIPDDDCYTGTVIDLTDDERKIVQYAGNKWDGNTHALLAFVSLYMSLPKSDRADIAGMGLHQYEQAQASGRVDLAAPCVDYDFIEREWYRLFK